MFCLFIFIDSIFLSYVKEQTKNKETVALLGTNIAWDTDKNVKFKNPPGATLKEGKSLHKIFL